MFVSLTVCERSPQARRALLPKSSKQVRVFTRDDDDGLINYIREINALMRDSPSCQLCSVSMSSCEHFIFFFFSVRLLCICFKSFSGLCSLATLRERLSKRSYRSGKVNNKSVFMQKKSCTPHTASTFERRKML